ncbi:MAG: glycosyltransferase [Methylophilaceae bacterium]
MPENKPIHILYLTSEQWPTFRADLIALFGKYLPRYGVTCDLVTELDLTVVGNVPQWGGGNVIGCTVPKSRAIQYLLKTWHNLKTLFFIDAKKYDAIQVRDMSVTALFALIAARVKGIPFFYWLSFPQSEGQIARATARGYKAGMRYWFPLLQGILGRWLLYKIVFPYADHIFVQSKQMQQDMVAQGISFDRLTPVPMGVDMENAIPEDIQPTDDQRLLGKRVLVYLGTLDRARHIELLFEMLAILKKDIPNIYLILAGDTEDAEHRQWLEKEASRMGVIDDILWTGWLPTKEAWRYVRAAEVGLSPFPRGYLLDSASPTKAIEYMAMGLPVVANDNPDQMEVIVNSKGGVCVSLTAKDFAEGVHNILCGHIDMRAVREKVKEYIVRNRSYDFLARDLSLTYQKLIAE